MKSQILILLVVLACAFADEDSSKEAVTVADIVEDKTEADVAETTQIAKEDEEANEKPTELPIDDVSSTAPPNDDSEPSQDVDSDPPIDQGDSDDSQSEDKKDDLVKPMLEWNVVFGKFDIDAIYNPIEVYWPSNWMKFVETIHPEGIKITSYDPEQFYKEFGYYPAK